MNIKNHRDKLEEFILQIRTIKAKVELKNCIGFQHSEVCQLLTKLQLEMAEYSDSLSSLTVLTQINEEEQK